MKKLFLPFLALSFSLLSCQKEEVPEKVCELNDNNLAGTYRLTAVTYKKDAASPTVNEFAAYPACQLDDEVVFKADKTISFNDTGIACTPPKNSSSTWSIAGNVVTFGIDPFVVSSFDCKQFSGTFTGDAPGELTTITLTRK